jgi:hypothetical protein
VRLFPTLLVVVFSGVTSDRTIRIPDGGHSLPAASALTADSASICWQRFNRGVAVETSCTTLGVTARVDTVRDTIRLQQPATSQVPFAFGPFDMYLAPEAARGFTAGLSYADPKVLIPLLARLRANQQRAFLALTGGAHRQYITDGRFDLDKWKAGVARYDTPVLKAALEAGVADGTILGFSMMDEPPHPSWGGVLTKATVDTMAGYCKTILPFMPCGVLADYRWRPAERYQQLDFLIAQTWKETGTPTAFRDSAVAMARRNGVALVLSLNLFGAARTPGCERQGNLCLMRPVEVREWGRAFLSEPYACAVLMWHYEANLWSRPEYQAQFQDLSSVARQRVARSCRPPS